jgi:hypothetical protein
MDQTELFTRADGLAEGKQRKSDGQRQVEEHNLDFVSIMRVKAAEIASGAGSVTVDDLRRYSIATGIKPKHPNAWGAIFRGSSWEAIGWVRSTMPSRHAGMVRVWRLKGQ